MILVQHPVAGIGQPSRRRHRRRTRRVRGRPRRPHGSARTSRSSRPRARRLGRADRRRPVQDAHRHRRVDDHRGPGARAGHPARRHAARAQPLDVLRHRIDLAAVNTRVKALAAAQSADIRAPPRARGRADRRSATAASTDRHAVVVSTAEGADDLTLDADVVLVATGATPRKLPDAPARRRAHPHVDPAVRPAGAAGAAHRRRFRRHRRRVRRRLHVARRRGRAGLQPRPCAARRGRRRRRSCSRMCSRPAA